MVKTIKARLESPLEEKSFSKRGEVFILSTREKALFYFPKNTLLDPGQVFEARVTLKRPRSSLNPFCPDFSRQKRASGLKWIGSVKYLKALPHLRDSPLLSLRQELLDFSRKLSPPARGLFEALVLGLKTNLSPAVRENFSRLGIFHFLAISGLHLALLLGFVSFLLRGLFWLWPRPLLTLSFKHWVVIVGLPALTFYALLSGPTPSALRALVMFLLWGFALFLWREIKALDLLALAVMVILFVQPESVGSFSFRLSVCAVLGIFLLRENASFLLQSKRKTLKYLKEGFGYSLAATLATLPWILLLKGQASPWAPITNLLALPVFGLLILPGEILTACLVPFKPDLAAHLAEKLAFVTKIPDLRLPQIEPLFPLGAFVLILSLPVVGIFLFPRNFKWGFLVAGILAAFFYKMQANLRYVLILDVGQGSAGVAKIGPKEALLFDAGPKRGNYDTAEAIIIPTLRKLGLSPQAVIVSHFQSDHTGGLKAIRDHFPTLKLYSPLSQEKGIGEEMFALVFLRDPNFSSRNEASLVSILEISGHRFLFPGDVGRKRERELLLEDIAAEVLILPHHGAKESATWPFLKKVAPKVAVSSARSSNHPARETLKRLKALGIPHLSTKEQGAISFLLEGRKLWLCSEDERRKKPLLWRALWPYLKVGCKPLPETSGGG